MERQNGLQQNRPTNINADRAAEKKKQEMYADIYSQYTIGRTLQRHNTENSKQIFPEKELRGLSPNFQI